MIADRAGLPGDTDPFEGFEPGEAGLVGVAPGWADAPITLRPSRRPLWWSLSGVVVIPASVEAYTLGITEVPPLVLLLPAVPFLILPDEAPWCRVHPSDSGTWLKVEGPHKASVLVRRGNVLIGVDYEALSRSDVPVQAQALARTIAAKIELD